jgi:hypothetical protein
MPAEAIVRGLDLSSPQGVNPGGLLFIYSVEEIES